MSEKEIKSGRFAYDGLSRIIHEKARLGIMTSLLTNRDGLLFSELKELCSLTDGNLSRHIQHLQEEGLLDVFKGFKDKRPQTLCRLTEEGRKQFIDYLVELENVIKDASTAKSLEDTSRSVNSLNGWLAI
ncbi:MAG: transcriptional regulator [Spirochaetota bacterium]|nr:transcriptional regulator [Spirochaetota bacterium]